MQHYGIKTRWVDVVDNVWIALWFACQTAHATGKQGEHLHFEQRRPNGKAGEALSKPRSSRGDKAQTSGSSEKIERNSDYAYIFLIKVDHTPDKDKPGFFEGNSSEMIDLRVAAPSTFLRPHAQTGLLVRQNGKIGAVTRDYKDMVAGIVRVSLDDALSWLGDGKLLSTHVLFPPPVYDFGYRDLLNFAPTPPSPHLLGRSSHPLLSVRCFRCFLISHFKIPTAISPVTTSGDRRKTGDRLCCPCWK